MNIIRASSDTGRYAVDHGHKVDLTECDDETGFAAQAVEAGIRRAEDERRRAATLQSHNEQEDLL